MHLIERLGPADWERLRAVRMRALRDAPDAFWVRAEEEQGMPPGGWSARLEGEDVAWWVAVGANGDVGLVAAGRHRDDPADAALWAMWVAPQARGRGVAAGLIDAAVGWAHAAGYRRVRLWVADANAAAQRTYRRRGFVPTGVTGTFPEPRGHIGEQELALPLDRKEPR